MWISQRGNSQSRNSKIDSLSGLSVLGPIRAELTRLNPAEIIHPDNLIIPTGITGHLTEWPSWRFEPGKSKDALLTHFEVSTLDGFGLKNLPVAIRAAGWGLFNTLRD